RWVRRSGDCLRGKADTHTLGRMGAGCTLFLTFSVFKASLIVEASMTSKAFPRHFPVREGDGCVKDTDHLSRHASSRLTLDVYAQALTPAKRTAHLKVVEMIRPAVE